MMLTDMADVLRAGGLTVQEHPGWKTRTQTDGPFAPRALIFHHDASAVGPSPTVPAYLADTSHPGAQLWVAYDGTWHTIAAGRMWHAGAGGGWGVIPAQAGNTFSVGVETDHTTGEPWPPAQLAAIIKGVAALCSHYGWDPAIAVCGHKEYAPLRKVDPAPMDMAWFRSQLAAIPSPPPPTGPPALPRWSLPLAHYYGLITGPDRSHGGYNLSERPIIRIIQQRLIAKGYVPGVTRWDSNWADGLFEAATLDAVFRFQHHEMLDTQFYGQVWQDDYARLAR